MRIGSPRPTEATRQRRAWPAPLAGHTVPAAASTAILGSLGGALEVARIAGRSVGASLVTVARHAFVEGMDEGLAVGAVVVAASAVLVGVALPARRRHGRDKGPRRGPPEGAARTEIAVSHAGLDGR